MWLLPLLPLSNRYRYVKQEEMNLMELEDKQGIHTIIHIKTSTKRLKRIQLHFWRMYMIRCPMRYPMARVEMLKVNVCTFKEFSLSDSFQLSPTSENYAWWDVFLTQRDRRFCFCSHELITFPGRWPAHW